VSHTYGSAALWVRASASPPGIWPPVLDDEGDVHVDGGVLDNLRVQLMRDDERGRIVTVNVSPYHRWPPTPFLARTPGARALDFGDVSVVAHPFRRSSGSSTGRRP
jgi:predicted acylesterase/phospholipase RssA